MNQALYLAVFSVAITLIAFGIRPLAESDALSETQKLEWVRNPTELRKVPENSPYMRNER